MDILGSTYTIPSCTQKRSENHPYSSSLASSASSSSSSVFSLDGLSTLSTVSSASTSTVDVIWENEASESQTYQRCTGGATEATACPRVKSVPRFADAAIAPELRQNPRRTQQCGQPSVAVPTSCPRQPPSLIRQCERKISFVDNLVGELGVWSNIDR